jgi:4-amino-4-deoxy-L-arabinose transferase-like glycosyltransferase
MTRARSSYGAGAGLAAILALGVGLRLWNIGLGEFGSEYYSAAVRSMCESAHNFFFDSFDPAGFTTVDKPPLALWIQCLSVTLLGFSGPAILLPQALEGIAAIALVYGLVARSFGQKAALLASLILAVNPVSVAADRSSNLESCLVLLLLLAVWAVLASLRDGRGRYFIVAMALVGAAFNTKFLAGWVIAPVFLGVYLAAAPEPMARRLGVAALALAVLLFTSLAWIAAFDHYHAPDRPHVAKTRHDSMFELAFATYGTEVVSGEGSPVNPVQSAEPGRRRSPFFDDVDPGLPRLLDRHLAGQVDWFAPLVLVGIGVALGFGRRPKSERVALAVWVGWAVLYGLAFAYDRGTFHGYYLAAIGPPLAVLAAVGTVELGRKLPGRGVWVAAVLAATAAWQIYIEGEAGRHFAWIPIAVVLGTGLGIIVALVQSRVQAGGVAIACASLLIAPMAWALSSVLVLRVNTLVPSADILRLAHVARDPIEFASSGYGVATDDQRLFAFLLEHATTEEFVLATPNARLAAPVIIHTGRAVLAIGGFSGQDGYFTPDDLIEWVKAGRVRYVLLGDDLAFGSGTQGQAREREFLEVALRIGQRVDTPLWRTPRTPLAELLRSGAPLRLQGARMQLYDLRPDLPPASGADRALP